MNVQLLNVAQDPKLLNSNEPSLDMPQLWRYTYTFVFSYETLAN